MNHTATPWEPPTGRHNAFSLENVKNLSFIQKNDFFFDWIFSNESASCWTERKTDWYTHTLHTQWIVLYFDLCALIWTKDTCWGTERQIHVVLQFYTHTVDLGVVCLAAFLPLRGQYGPPRGASDWPLGLSITASIQSCELWSCDAGSAAVQSSTHLSTSICSSCLCGCNPELILLFGVCRNHMKVGWRVYCSICPSGQGDIALAPRGQKSGLGKMGVGMKDNKCPPLRGLNVRVSGLYDGMWPLMTVQINQFTKMNQTFQCYLRETV